MTFKTSGHPIKEHKFREITYLCNYYYYYYYYYLFIF